VLAVRERYSGADDELAISEKRAAT